MPVGNDVVDLRDPANRPEALHSRFDRRVFGDADLARLAACHDEDARHRLRWTLWAARESAFKYLRQLTPDVIFRPRAVRVRLDDEEAWSAGERVTGRVFWPGDDLTTGGELLLSLDADDHRVHAVVRSLHSGPVTEALRSGAADPSPAAASSGVRELAAQAVARCLSLDPKEVRIATPRPADGIPRALSGDQRLPVVLSMSHDGRWLACAVVHDDG